jgi:hypothetical protein
MPDRHFVLQMPYTIVAVCQCDVQSQLFVTK